MGQAGMRRRGASTLGFAAIALALLLAPAAADARAVPRHHQPVDRYEVTDTTAYPHRTTGKVFADFGDRIVACSGSVVSSPNGSVVVTAGHCAHAIGGPQAQTLVFIPGYRDGARPFGTWTAHSIHVDPGWVEGTDLNSDFAAFVVERGPGGATLEETVGARPIAFGSAPPGSLTAFGYPAYAPFDGERLFACASAQVGTDAQADSNHTGPPGLTLPCDYYGGASGGPIVDPAGAVVSVHSHAHPGEDGHVYGPRLGASARAVYDAAAAIPVPGGPAPPDAGPPPPDSPPPAGAAISLREPKVKGGRVKLRFGLRGADAPGVRFGCRLDRGRWSACASPARYRGLRPGRHVFRVRALGVEPKLAAARLRFRIR